MRMSVRDKPRVIGNAENFLQHIALPRGCLDAALNLMREHEIAWQLCDERFAGERIDFTFAGTLRPDQEAAVSAMLRHDAGVLCAPTDFGKTVTAAEIIVRRGVNTLVLVHRTELLKQWQERLRPRRSIRLRSGGCRAWVEIPASIYSGSNAARTPQQRSASCTRHRRCRPDDPPPLPARSRRRSLSSAWPGSTFHSPAPGAAHSRVTLLPAHWTAGHHAQQTTVRSEQKSCRPCRIWFLRLVCI